MNLGIALKLGIPVREVKTPEAWRRARKDLDSSTVVVDAIFGTGLFKPLEGLFARVVGDINKARAFKIAIDIPSGLSSDTFEIIGPCVRADLTVTLAAPKIAHVFPPSDENVGDLVVADISVPPFLFDKPELRLEMVGEGAVAPFFRKRKKDAHKGTYGHLLVVAGSLGKSGAAALAGRAALKTGAGLVTVATAESALPGIARSMMELMTEPLPETPQKTIAKPAAALILSLLEGKDGLLLGPGISTHPGTAEFVRALLPKVRVPVVIDADGLNCLAANLGILKRIKGPAVLTPHPGEFGRLVGTSARDVLARRLELAPSFAKKYGVILVLKGYRTLIAAPDGRVFVNPTGNPGLASGGTGDVLAGMIGSQIVQEKKDLLGAVLSAVYAHGLSGDLAASKVGEKALTAADLIKFLPAALKSLEPA